MPEQKSVKKIAIIVASTRPGRSADKVLEWFMPLVDEFSKGAKSASGDPVKLEIVDLKDWPMPFIDEPGYPSMGRNYTQEHTKRWSAKIDEFSGFIILANEYNHGYSGVLKNSLDYLYKEWNNKPVSFVSYGSGAGGSRAVEQLRQVVVELQMIPLREQVLISLSEFFSPDNQASMKKWREQAEKTIKQIISRV